MGNMNITSHFSLPTSTSYFCASTSAFYLLLAEEEENNTEQTPRGNGS